MGALAVGKTPEEVRQEGVEEDLIIHRTFTGNRPSSSILLPQATAYATGQLLAIYEHRTAVQGFIWDVNSFDQWGVELGKKLAIDVKEHLMKARADPEFNVDTGRPATTRILNYFVDNNRSANTSSNTESITGVTRKTYRKHHPSRA